MPDACAIPPDVISSAFPALSLTNHDPKLERERYKREEDEHPLRNIPIPPPIQTRRLLTHPNPRNPIMLLSPAPRCLHSLRCREVSRHDGQLIVRSDGGIRISMDLHEPQPPTCAPAVSGVVQEGDEASRGLKHLDVGIGKEAEVGRGRTQHLVLQVQGGGARGREGDEEEEAILRWFSR